MSKADSFVWGLVIGAILAVLVCAPIFNEGGVDAACRELGWDGGSRKPNSCFVDLPNGRYQCSLQLIASGDCVLPEVE